METVLRDSGAPHRVLPWEPWGGDERQFCSPGFDLPVGTLMRTPHGEFAGYHTSADGLERIRPESLAEAVDTCLELVDVLESNRRCTNLSPYGEPQLGRRGLYRSAGGAVATPDDERALLWVLNLSDGRSTLLDVARQLRPPLPGGAARRGAARAGRAARLTASQARWSGQARSRSEMMRSLGGRPVDAEGGVVPADPARGLGHVVVRHLVEDLGVVLERLVALREPFGNVGQALVRGAAARRRASRCASVSRDAGPPSRGRSSRACSAPA